MAKANKAKNKGAKLGEYQRKRDFAKTGEPAPRKRRAPKAKRPRFVVQEHSARRLHWDLRLEHEGAAASWAVPNGIPVDPDENRMAVHTEDHPLEYLEWEGEIPKGEYGAGTMRVWDRGTYSVEKWTDSKITFTFEGERLQGRYALFRAGHEEKDWMIHRIDPPAEQRDPFPESVVPMLAKLAPLPAKDDGWAVEVKWDGVRAIAYCRPGRLELETRNLNRVTGQYPEIRRLARQLGSREAVLDGELVAFDADGRPSFERLQQRIHQTSASVVRRRVKSHPVTYVIFDLLYLEGASLLEEPYSHRRELLEGLGLEGESWQTPGHSVGHVAELLAASAEQQLEGIVLKRLDSHYAPGKRSGAWLKVKNLGRQELAAGEVGVERADIPTPAAIVPRGGARKRTTVTVEGRELGLSNLDKVLYPGPGFTKGQLIDWYARMGEVLLPHLRGRPLTMKRYPDGVEGKFFYEKRCPSHRPEWVPTAKVWSERHKEEIEYCLVEDRPTLVWAANLANVELHTSLSPAAEIERPTSLVFDLDPGTPADVLDCAQVALWIRGMFEQFGLRCYPKTSGSKGIQVYVPLNTDVTYDVTKPFAKAVAETLESKFPDRVVSRMAKSRRDGKVLVDWSQNDQHKTTVCVYSLRAKERPTVSTPLEWEELEAALAAGDGERLVFDYADVLRRVEEKGDLFAPLLSQKQRLPT
jgi:bifunctional non-homologous end joining protein LigD